MKSLSAFLLTFALRKARKKYFTPKDGDVLDNDKDYELSPSLNLKCEVEEERFSSRKVFILNKNSRKNITMIYLHGGGYVLPFFSMQWKYIDKITSKTGIKCYCPDYRLAPKGTYKEAYELLLPLYQEIIKRYPHDKIILMGDSAGGGLSSGLYLELAKNNIKLPDELILVSPWIDLTNELVVREKDPLLTKAGLLVAANMWAKGTDKKDYRVSPYFGDTSLLNNVTMIYGDDEILYPSIDAFADKIKNNRNNRIYLKKGMNHIYPFYPIKEAKEATDIIINTIMR